MNLIMIFSIFFSSFAKDCSKYPSDYTKIVGKQGEIIIKEDFEFFNDYRLSNDTFTLTDEGNNLQLIYPIMKLSEDDFQSNLEKIISYSVLTNSDSEWLNMFQIFGIGQQNKYYVFSTSNSIQGMQQRIPYTNTQQFIGTTDEMNCRSSIIIDSNHQLIDCESNLEDDSKNYFLLLVGSQPSVIEKISNQYPYNNQVRYIKGTQKYIYRVSIKQNDNPSLIEIFSYNLEEKKFELKYEINQEFVTPYLNITDYQFDLADVKIGYNDEIAILDKTGNIYKIQYIELNDTWKFDYQAILLGESITFDYEFKTNQYAVVQKNQVKFFFKNYQTTYVTADDLSQAKVYLCQNNILVATSTKLIKLSLFFPYTLLGNFDYILHDYTQDDFTIIGLDKFRYYQMYQSHYIRYQNFQVSKGQGILKKNSCQVTIDYQTLEYNSVELILVSKGCIAVEPFYSGSTFLNAEVNHLVDGPKQKIDISQKGEKYQGGQFQQLQYNTDQMNTYNQQIINLENLIFIETLSYAQSIDKPFYIFTQNKDKLLKIYYCGQFPYFDCYSYNEIQMDKEINKQNTVFSLNYQRLNIYTINNTNELIQYQYFTSTNVTTHHYFFSDEDSINSIYQSSFYILIYTNLNQKITVYGQEYLGLPLYTISAQEVKRLGIINWNPKKIFTNDFDAYVNIINDDHEEFIIFNLKQNDFSLFYLIQNDLHTDIRIINFYKKFAIIYKKQDGTIIIKVYDTQIQTNIHLQKQISLYDYEIDNINSFFYVTYNSYLHTKAQRPSDKKQVLLSFNIQLTSHNSLKRVEEINDENQFLCATQNLVFQFNKKDITITYIQENPTLTYRVRFNDNTFITNLDYQIIYANEMLLLVDQQFKLVNTNMDVQIIKDKLNITTNLTSNKQNHYVQEMGNDWYLGEVTKFSVSIPQQNCEIKITNPIELINDDYQNSTVGVADLNNEHIFLLQNDSFIIMSKSKNTKVSTKMLPENKNCVDILFNSDSQLLIECVTKNDQKHVILGIQCKLEDCTIGEGFVEIDNGDKIISVIIDKDFIFLIQRKNIKVYQNLILNLSQAKLYGNIIFEQYYSVYGQTVQKIQDNFYHVYYVYCFNQYREFIIHDYYFYEEKFVMKQEQRFDYKEEILKDYFFFNSPYVTQILLINIVNQDQKFSADYIFFATQGPHFTFNLEFSIKTDSSQLLSNKIVFILQGYGYGSHKVQGDTQPKVKILNSLIMISYENLREDKQILTLYKLPEKYSTNQTIQFFGVVNSKDYDNKNIVLKELYFYENQLYLLTNTYDYQTLYQYKVNPSPLFIIDGNVSTSNGILTVQNDFSQNSIDIKITAPVDPTPDPDDPSDTKSNHIVLWIILGCVGACIIIGGIIYMMKKKKTRVEERLI